MTEDDDRSGSDNRTWKVVNYASNGVVCYYYSNRLVNETRTYWDQDRDQKRGLQTLTSLYSSTSKCSIPVYTNSTSGHCLRPFSVFVK